MNIVMVDRGQLAGLPEFPPIDLPKFAWLEFVSLQDNEIDERCWRADVIVSTNTTINASVIKESFKLRLIVAAGDKIDHIDLSAARARGVIVCNVPGLTGDTPENAQKISEQVVENIHAWLNESPVNIIN